MCHRGRGQRRKIVFRHDCMRVGIVRGMRGSIRERWCSFFLSLQPDPLFLSWEKGRKRKRVRDADQFKRIAISLALFYLRRSFLLRDVCVFGLTWWFSALEELTPNWVKFRDGFGRVRYGLIDVRAGWNDKIKIVFVLYLSVMEEEIWLFIFRNLISCLNNCWKGKIAL